MAQLANVAQLTGVDVGGLVSMIVQAVGTVRRNKKCRKLARRVGIVGDLLQRLQDPETMQDPVVRKPLSELEETLRHAYTLVSSCQNSSTVYRLFWGWKQAEQLREVQESITDTAPSATSTLCSVVHVHKDVRGSTGEQCVHLKIMKA